MVIGDYTASQDNGITFLADATNSSTIGFTDDTHSTVRGAITYHHSGDSLRFNTFTTEKMRITNTGNVGIGTSSPSHSLQVSDKFGVDTSNSFGRIYLGRPVSPNLSSIMIQGTDVGEASNTLSMINYSGVGMSIELDSSASAMVFNVSGASTERMRINSSGNVGIGTTSPSSKLHVAGNFTSTGIDDNATSTAITINSSQNVNMGSLGISNSSPVGQLHIHNFSGSDGFRITRGTGITGVGMHMVASSSTNFLSAYGDLVLRTNTTGSGTNAAERMRITSSGNVGIGLTDPDQNLEVQGRSHLNGTVYSEVFNQAITADGWVFVRTMGADEGFQVFACVPGANSNESKFASALVFRGGSSAPLMTVLQGDGLLNLRVNGNDVEVYRSSSTGGGLRNTRVTFLKVAYV
jgi:hypothetical protein